MIPIAEVLKDHELYCYQIAYYLLEQEQSAVLATEMALIELGQCESFIAEYKEERMNRAKKVTTKHCLAVAILGE